MANDIKLMNSCDIQISNGNLEDFCIIIFKDLMEDYKAYFSIYEEDGCIYVYGQNGESEVIAYFNDGEYISRYGKIENIIDLKDLILTFGTISSMYTIEEINEIINNFINKYISLQNSGYIKKLELK